MSDMKTVCQMVNPLFLLVLRLFSLVQGKKNVIEHSHLRDQSVALENVVQVISAHECCCGAIQLIVEYLGEFLSSFPEADC